MKVKELKKLLESYDENLDVVVLNNDSDSNDVVDAQIGKYDNNTKEVYDPQDDTEGLEVRDVVTIW